MVLIEFLFRRILDPAFSHQILSEHSPKFHKVAERMVEALWKKQEENGNVELRAAIRPFTAGVTIGSSQSSPFPFRHFRSYYHHIGTTYLTVI